jgi:hypothetical protein
MCISTLSNEQAECRDITQGAEQVRGRLLVGRPQYVQEQILACGTGHSCAFVALLALSSIRVDKRASDIE